MSDREIISLLVRIEGRVQGVGFRGWVLSRAHAAGGVAGWVRNRRDGSVETLFSGERFVVDALVNECRVGPGLARVDRLTTTPTSLPIPSGFKWLPTV